MSPLVGIGNTGEDAYDTLDLATCVTLKPAKSIIGVPPVPRYDGWKSARSSTGKICLQAFDRRHWWESGHRRDAYDTLRHHAGAGDAQRYSQRA
jgi:hypothetical protein